MGLGWPLTASAMASVPARIAVVEAVLLQRRADALLDDVLRLQIGQLPLDAFARLDADPTLGDRDDEQDAVVLARLAELPAVERAVGHVLDRLAPE